MRPTKQKTQDEVVEISKFLSLVLRHQPEAIGLRLDENGWADIGELIDKISLARQAQGKSPIDKSKLDMVVASNDKKRFAYSDCGWKIRASQGHSVEVDLNLLPKPPPTVSLSWNG